MNYISVSEAAKKWNISERSVRNYCAEGRVAGAVLVGKIWMIPEGAEKPIRKIRSDAAPETLLDILRREWLAIIKSFPTKLTAEIRHFPKTLLPK